MKLHYVPTLDTLEPQAPAAVPLMVELEGALVSVDLRQERLASILSEKGPRAVWRHLTGKDSEDTPLSPDHVPYAESVVRLAENARAGKRPVYLLYRENRKEAEAIAAHLGLFDGVVSIAAFSSGETGLSRARYDLVTAGRDAAALGKGARQVFTVGLSEREAEQLTGAETRVDRLALTRPANKAKALLKLLRPHQYAKNALVLVPMLTAHALSLHNLALSLLALLAFNFTASAVYVLNDLVDLHADRSHPTKKNRPFAAGTVSLAEGLMLVPLLLSAAISTAALLPVKFSLLLAAYFATTTAYSFALKRMMLVDVIVLALLYTLRVVAGAAAITVPMSEWLFAFSVMIFTSLALVKRYIELSTRLDQDLPDPSNRDYKITDLPVIAALAAAAGMNAITVLALYVNSEKVVRFYSHPEVLWLLCPTYLYWTARTLLLAHRRQMHDDPIVFALKDRRSWLVGALTLAIVALAM